MSAALVHKGFHPPGYDPKGCPVCALSAQRTPLTLVPERPAPAVWVERHCEECGLLEPHHHSNCTLKWEDQ